MSLRKDWRYMRAYGASRRVAFKCCVYVTSFGGFENEEAFAPAPSKPLSEVQRLRAEVKRLRTKIEGLQNQLSNANFTIDGHRAEQERQSYNDWDRTGK